MNIWRFNESEDTRFAQAGGRGAWSESAAPCPECGASRQERTKPLRLVWEPGSDTIGDFTTTMLSDVAVSDRAMAALNANFQGFERGPVEILEYDLPLSGADRKLPRVTYPYQGPPLSELWVTAWVSADEARSTMDLEREPCGTCGREVWNVYGLEHWDLQWDKESMTGSMNLVSRLPGAGIYVSQAEVDGADVFRVRQLPGWVFCTDRVRQLISDMKLSNASFLEVGQTF